MLNTFENHDKSSERRLARERQLELMAEATSGRNLPSFMDEEVRVLVHNSTERASRSSSDGSEANNVFDGNGSRNSVQSAPASDRSHQSSSSEDSHTELEKAISDGLHAPPLGATEAAAKFLWEDDIDGGIPTRTFDGSIERETSERGSGAVLGQFGGWGGSASSRNYGADREGGDLRAASIFGSSNTAAPVPEGKEMGLGAKLRGIMPTFGPDEQRGHEDSRSSRFSKPPRRGSSTASNSDKSAGNVSFKHSHSRHTSTDSVGSMTRASVAPTGFNLAPRRNSLAELDRQALSNVDLTNVSDVSYEYTGKYGGDKYAGYDDDNLPPIKEPVGNRTSRKCATGIAAFFEFAGHSMCRMLAIAAVVVLVVVAAISASNRLSSRPDATPTTSDSVEVPEAAARVDALIQRIVDAGASPFVAFETTNSPLTPQRRAIEWLANKDPMALDPQDTFLLQRFALAVFWYSTHEHVEDGDEGSDWRDDDGWITGKGICAWAGVSCHHRPGTSVDDIKYDDNNMVTYFNMEGNNVAGELPAEIFTCLQDLRKLNLHNNSIEGGIRTEIGLLRNLQSLDLSLNSLQGSIPEEIGLIELVKLNIAENQLTGRIPPELGELFSLQELSLFSNSLTGPIPSAVTDLTLLRSLYLDSNQLTSSIPSSVGRMESLLDLRLRDNKLTGSIPSQIANLANLVVLYFDTNKLSGPLPSELSHLRHLEELDAYGNMLSGSLPPEFGNLTALHHIYLDNNNFNGDFPRSWSSLRDVKHLFIDNNRIVGMIPSEVGEMQGMEILQMEGNSFTGTIPTELGGLLQMKELSLEDNRLTGSVPEELGGLINLERLTLHGNQITGTMPESVCVLVDNMSLEEVTVQCSVASEPAEGRAQQATVECNCCTSCPREE